MERHPVNTRRHMKSPPRSPGFARDLYTKHLVINSGMEDMRYTKQFPQSVNTAVPVGDIGPQPLPDYERTPAKKSVRRWLVGVIAFLYISSYVMSFFTFSQYAYNYMKVANFHGIELNDSISICILNKSSDDFLIQMKVQEIAATWAIYYNLAGGVVAIVGNLILGSYTDKFGRKFLFFLPCIGTLFRTGLAAAGIRLSWDLSYYIIGYVIEGLTGQMFSLLLVSFTYVADITSSGKQRSLGLAFLELVVGLGSAAMSFASGFYVQSDGFWDPMVASMIMLVAAIVLIIFLPEPYTAEQRQLAEAKFENLKIAGRLYCGSSNYGYRWRYIIMLIVFMTSAMVTLGRIGVEGLYQMDFPFCWSPVKLGWFGALKSGIQQVLSMGMVVVLQLKFSDEVIAIIGCISYAGGFILEAFAQTDLMLYLVTVVGALGLLTLPMVRAIMSRMTSVHHQGAVFASVGAAETFCSVTSGALASAIYSATIDLFRGFVFLVFAGLNILGVVLMIIYYVLTKPKSSYKTLESPDG